jgi:hypothetical protein
MLKNLLPACCQKTTLLIFTTTRTPQILKLVFNPDNITILNIKLQQTFKLTVMHAVVFLFQEESYFICFGVVETEKIK